MYAANAMLQWSLLRYDMQEGNMTTVVKADPVRVAAKRWKLGHGTELLVMGPAKEEWEDRLTNSS